MSVTDFMKIHVILRIECSLAFFTIWMLPPPAQIAIAGSVIVELSDKGGTLPIHIGSAWAIVADGRAKWVPP